MNKTTKNIIKIAIAGLIGIMGLVFLVLRQSEVKEKKKRKEGIISTLMFSYATVLGLKGDLKAFKGIHPRTKEILRQSVIGKEYKEEYERLDDDILKGRGNLFSLNEEEIVKRKIKTIWSWNNMSQKQKRLYQKLGIRVELFKYSHEEKETLNWIKKIAEGIGEEKRYREYKKKREKLKEEMRKRIPKKKQKALYFYNYKERRVSGEFSYQQTHFEVTGLDNAVNEAYRGSNGLPRVSVEAIIKMNPDIILIRSSDKTKIEEILKDERLKSINAIKEKRAYRTPIGAYDMSSPGLENDIFWIWLAKIGYPRLYSDYRLKKEIKKRIEWLYSKKTVKEKDYNKILNIEENGSMKYYSSILK